MSKLESEYKAWMCKDVIAAGGYAIRVEDQYRVGVLDTILSTRATGTILAEVKRFEHQAFAASKRQWEEIKRWRAAGTKACLIGVHIGTNVVYIARPGDEEYTTAGNCVRQEEGETFTELLTRWNRIYYVEGQ